VIHNLVRAAVPWPVAHCLFKGQVYRIHQTLVVDGQSDQAPGTVVGVEQDRVVVATGENALAILVFQAPGKRALAMGAFLRGQPITPGDEFEDLPDPETP